MSSDIKLEETFVVVEGNALKVNAWDIMLDGGPDRRGGNIAILYRLWNFKNI
jgi:hypothetical protein